MVWPTSSPSSSSSSSPNVRPAAAWAAKTWNASRPPEEVVSTVSCRDHPHPHDRPAPAAGQSSAGWTGPIGPGTTPPGFPEMLRGVPGDRIDEHPVIPVRSHRIDLQGSVLVGDGHARVAERISNPPQCIKTRCSPSVPHRGYRHRGPKQKWGPGKLGRANFIGLSCCGDFGQWALLK